MKMGAGSILFSTLVILATVTQAYPGVPNLMPKATKGTTTNSSKMPEKTSSPNPISVSSASAATSLASIYAADAAGPRTTLFPEQIQNDKQEAQIAAIGSSEYAAGTASTASVASASAVSAAAAATAPANCNDGSWELTIANYNNASTDENLKTWWFGGTDTDGYTYGAKTWQKNFLTQALAIDFEPVGSELVCTLESQSCVPIGGCNSYNVHIGNTVGRPSHWGWFAIHSVANLYSFVASFAESLTNAGVDVSLLNLDLTQTFTKPAANPDIFTRELLTGFAFLATVAFTAIPIVGEVYDAGLAAAIGSGIASTTVAAISNSNAELGLILTSGATLDTKAASFGAYMASVFNNTAAGVDSLITDMMQGNNLGFSGGTPLLLDVLYGGGWVTTDVITSKADTLTRVQSLLQKDLIQRGINQIWSQSKIWVSFVNLNDDSQTTKCLADRSGWQASKTCADGGVYYLYRFNEDGHLSGELAYPWGADKMSSSPWNLNPSWVTHSSAAAYRSQNNGTGGFAYDYTKTPTNLPTLLEAVGRTNSLDNLNALEGVWNISVCDMGTHSDWNTDFTQNPVTSPWGLVAFPCCCGPQCSQTADFVRSAQMENFDTIVMYCKIQLAMCNTWPEGVTEIDFGQAGTITKQADSNSANDVCVADDSGLSPSD